ncbi:MAG: NAD(P)H-dependent oxidoreductase [Granulosicoccus sp.]|nr:NAD(P)H-dependent oxidoreductase [Granulosicoccus sp.]
MQVRSNPETREAKLLLITGSLRSASLNRQLVLVASQAFGGTSILADLDVPLYNGDLEKAQGVPDGVLRLHAQIAESDAVAISTPEYNQSLSGVLKNALDWVSRVGKNPWTEKPVAIMSAAAGRAGGARAQYALRLALNPFQPRLLTGPEVMVAHAPEQFDNHGQLTSEAYQRKLNTLMGKLANEAYQQIRNACE